MVDPFSLAISSLSLAISATTAWLTLSEHYKDFITNGLDLMSFLLVTPELARFARPVIGRFFRVVSYVVTVVLSLTLGWIILVVVEVILAFIPIIFLLLISRIGYILGINFEKYDTLNNLAVSTLSYVLFASYIVVVSYYIFDYVVRKLPLRGIRELFDVIMERVGSHLFGMGALLFFISRILAVVFATQELVSG